MPRYTHTFRPFDMHARILSGKQKKLNDRLYQEQRPPMNSDAIAPNAAKLVGQSRMEWNRIYLNHVQMKTGSFTMPACIRSCQPGELVNADDDRLSVHKHLIRTRALCRPEWHVKISANVLFARGPLYIGPA